MEAVKDVKTKQGKKKVRRPKFKIEDENSESLENILQNIESVHVSSVDRSSCSRLECVDNVESEICEAFKDACDETVGLLQAESKDNYERPEETEPSSSWKNNLEFNQGINRQESTQEEECASPVSETELDEINSSVRREHGNKSNFEVDTTFDSPQHISSSSSVELAEEPDYGITYKEGSGTTTTATTKDALLADDILEVADEVCPSAPVLSSHIYPDIVDVSEVETKKNEAKKEESDEKSCVQENDHFSPLKFKVIEEEPSIKPFTQSQLASLYRNQELEENGEFISHFIETELRGGHVVRHPLYELLLGYLRARNRLMVNGMELETLKSDCKVHQSHLWMLQKNVVTESGECQDGNPVEASHEFRTAHFDKATAAKLSRSLSAIKELVNESHALNAYTCEVHKLQVEHYIQNIAMEFSFLPHNAPVNLVPEALPSFSSHSGRDLRVVIADLRLAIAVLFTFQRRPIKDEGFIADTRNWLTRLVAILLRVATWRDHMFILNHVLRCPGGVSSWATSFIQAPPPLPNSPFSLHHLDHLVTTLATILLPIQERDQFLSQLNTSVSSDSGVHLTTEFGVTSAIECDSVWVIVDSEGEDEAEDGMHNTLRENDVVSFFNQIPFDSIYRQVLHITRKDDQDIYDPSLISDHHVLRLMAFCSLLIELLEKGLSNHSAARYKQFSKRLGRLVRHTTQYATDQLQAFRNNNKGSADSAMLLRLQVEHDSLVMRAVSCLYHSPGRCAWQFLAVLPFGCVSLNTLWHMFCTLLQGDDDLVDELRWGERLEEHLTELSDAEVYYLLTTIATMAMSRTVEDWLFIQAVTLQLLEVGFLNTSTRDHCSKSASIMLANLASRHPALVTVLLEKLHLTSNATKLILYLVKDLPLNVWKPTETDLNILEDWLVRTSVTSIKHNLARYIISHLNWGFDSSEGSAQELFLPCEVHVRVALIVVQVAALYCPEIVTSSNTITESVRQVSYLASSMVRPQSYEQVLTVWVWQIAYKLRLHLMDQPDHQARATMADPVKAFSALPELESKSEAMSVLFTNVRKNQPMAIYMCLQITSLGHSVPLLCTKGFSLLSVLQSCHLHTAVISLLQHIVPLFLDCPESLIACEKFHAVLTSLLSADRTYLKVAKSLITSDFPGHILKQFGDMIQYHLDSYAKYNLSSPAPIAQLWLKCISNVWSEEPTSAAYIMDIVVRVAFFRPEVSVIAFDTLTQLLQTVGANGQTNSRLSSLFSWMSSGSGSVFSLVPQGSSCPHAPWFAYFALQVEEVHTQGKNGLWKEVLKELAATSGKASVDNALKRAANTLKIQQLPSSALPIYRWSQQALDTPVDHPVLPLIWQKFFTLYFTRVPSQTGGATDRGSVGDKFFEGMTNLSYHKRLKRKLNDCTEYFRTKAEDIAQKLTPERKMFYDNIAKLYRTYSLWLEEPRLHEPGLYHPALPPQYNPCKLTIICAGNESPWYEYVDYESVCNTQRECVKLWLQAQGRNVDAQAPRAPQSQEDSDPVQRIIKRLQSYDTPVSPPPLRASQPVVPSIQPDALLNKAILLDCLKNSFRMLMEYAQIYCLRVSEHTALDCAFLELVPTLYINIETEVTLHAACDTTEPGSQPRKRPPSASTLNCAGPAEIIIKVCSARANEAVEHQIQTNRGELEGLLKRSIQPPPSAVCIASIHIEHATQALSEECKELKRIGDIKLLNQLRDAGVALFYHISSVFTDENTSYPPLKQLFTTCIELLGQSFISGEENQCVRLLTTVIQNPQLAGLLGPHFTPSAADATTFLLMYSTLVDIDNTTGADLVFVLLTKFDVGQWLYSRRPRLAERSQLIELCGKALTMAGLNPSEDKLMIHEVFRHHLCTLFMFDFPEHYGEILHLALRYSENQSLAAEVWFDIVNSLAGAKFRPGLSLGQVKEEIHKYATQQKALTLQELRETVTMFGDHFMKERLQYGLYGLYPKYRVYVEPLTILLGMAGHALIAATLQNDRGSLSDKLCEQLWPNISGLFSPWLAPYFTRHLAEPTAAWIQQLTDDRSVLPPWIVVDGGHAQKMATMFVECIRFILDTLPACSNILSFVWQYYVTNYAHCSIKDHILSVIHSNFMTLPWPRFCPTVQDIDLMLKVVDQYLPDCHTFLGAIFIEVPWYSWVQQACNSYPTAVTSKVHSALLHLLIKLANEPNVRQSAKVAPLLVESQQFAWHLVDCTSYEAVANWFVMSYDPRVILQLNDEEFSSIDMASLDLLQVAAGFVPSASQFHPSTPRKRQMYVRASVKLLLSSVSRYKHLVTSRQDEIRSAVRRLVDRVETVSANVSNHQKVSEAGLLLTEVLTLVNQPANSPVTTLALNAILSWLSKRDCLSVVVAALLRVLGTTVANQEILGMLLESTLTAFFRGRVGENSNYPDWTVAVSVLQPIVPRHPPLEDSLVACGHVLSLYALILKHVPSTYDIREEANVLHNLTEWICAIKVNENVESKMPLLWSKALHLCQRQCEYSSDCTTGVRYLLKIAQCVTQNAEHRAGAGWGLLGAIGICKPHTVSNKCRFLSRVLATLIMVQLPEVKPDSPEQGNQFVRTKPYAPGSIISCNGETIYTPSSDALKAVSVLESLTTDKSYAELKSTIDFAIKLIKQPENSLHNADQIFINVTLQVYNDSFLHALKPAPLT